MASSVLQGKLSEILKRSVEKHLGYFSLVPIHIFMNTTFNKSLWKALLRAVLSNLKFSDKMSLWSFFVRARELKGRITHLKLRCPTGTFAT